MTPLDTPTPPPAPAGPTSNTGLSALQMLLTALFASAGFNLLLSLQQQMADHFTRPGVGKWFRYFAGAAGPMFPT